MIRLKFRGYISGALAFEEYAEVELDSLAETTERLADRHLGVLSKSKHMIEIEFLDELDPRERFFRIGTDPSMMVKPCEIDLSTFKNGKRKSRKKTSN